MNNVSSSISIHSLDDQIFTDSDDNDTHFPGLLASNSYLQDGNPTIPRTLYLTGDFPIFWKIVNKMTIPNMKIIILCIFVQHLTSPLKAHVSYEPIILLGNISKSFTGAIKALSSHFLLHDPNIGTQLFVVKS